MHAIAEIGGYHRIRSTACTFNSLKQDLRKFRFQFPFLRPWFAPRETRRYPKSIVPQEIKFFIAV